MLSSVLALIGEKLTDDEIPMDDWDIIHTIVELARFKPFKTKSDVARRYAVQVAAAASEGLITTFFNQHVYGDQWMITEKGLKWLRACDE